MSGKRLRLWVSKMVMRSGVSSSCLPKSDSVWDLVRYSKLLPKVCFFLLWIVFCSQAVLGQDESPIENSSMEKGFQGENLPGWRLMNPKAGRWAVDQKIKKKGKQSLQVNGSDSEGAGFTGIVQTIDGKLWRGKTVRLSAFVRTDGKTGTSAGLWFRVDRESGGFGAFDNMQDRPIKVTDWKEFSIVKKVDDDAKTIHVGLIVKGDGKVWVDDFNFQPTDEVATGGKSNDQLVSKKKSKAKTQEPVESNTPKIDPRFSSAREAQKTAHLAPQQPFLSPWLLLVIFSIGLFFVAQVPAGVPAVTETNTITKLPEENETQSTWANSVWVNFAFRFAFLYWLLFVFPSPLGSLLPGTWAYYIRSGRTWVDDQVVFFVAENIFHYELPLVDPHRNGSGDTTYRYIRAFCIFVSSIAFASLWTVFDRRKTDSRWMRDLLTSLVRFHLAIVMLSYGLAKVCWDMNQFPSLNEFQLERNWGENSPMGVLWRTMGCSRAYSVFGGAGEVLAAVLLIFRRTSLAGAFVAIGVMANVVMMNLCFDVPVKLNSFHFLIMAVFLVLPHTGRLLNLFLWNRPVDAIRYFPPFENSKTVWVHRFIKVVLILFAFVIPLFNHTYRQVVYLAKPTSSYMGMYEVVNQPSQPAKDSIDTDKGTDAINVTSKRADAQVSGSDQWTKVTIYERPDFGSVPFQVRKFLRVRAGNGKVATGKLVDENPDRLKVQATGSPGILPEGVFSISAETNSDRMLLTFEKAGKTVMVRLKRKEYRLIDRGFRWVNEVPFNR